VRPTRENVSGALASMLVSAHLFEPLAESVRLLVLDKRGTGLSDRSLGLVTLEERMSDVRAVMNAAGVEQAALLGISEGGAMCALMAASQPDRVSALVFLASFCPGAPPRVVGDDRDRLLGFIEHREHAGRVIDFFVQHAPDCEVALGRLAGFERYSCTPATAREIMSRNLESDIRSVLPTITCRRSSRTSRTTRCCTSTTGVGSLGLACAPARTPVRSSSAATTSAGSASTSRRGSRRRRSPARCSSRARSRT
jgi:pimeloyl-ACP methyl ester carboxylesterase